VSCAAQGLAEWSSFAHEQAAHGQVAHLSDFWVEFGQSTLENWQSEPATVLVRRSPPS